MHIVHPKKVNRLGFSVEVKIWKVPAGHRYLPGRVHKDARRPARGTARVRLRGELGRD